jgi:hypothetical protein
MQFLAPDFFSFRKRRFRKKGSALTSERIDEGIQSLILFFLGDKSETNIYKVVI